MAGPEFDLDRSIDEAWRSFSERLADVLASMDDSADLTIDSLDLTDDGTPQVRFHAHPEGVLRAEASSNFTLDDEFLLTPQQLQTMEDAGWCAPSSDADACGNFWVERTQDDAVALADTAVIALRDVYGVPHPVFLIPDQLAEILTQRSDAAELPVEAEDAEDVTAVVPVSMQHLESMVVDELTDLLGHIPLRDEDGDYAIRVGSCMVFARATPDHREVVVFSVIVHDIEGRSRAMEILNDLNAESRFVRFELIKDKVFVQMSVLAHPFVPSHFHQAVRAVSEVADSVDEHLAAKLHGRTTFG